ncbi:MAG: hypothetical protein U9Q88_19515 [Bacillota bacterium]|uniref:hypothetical protein n=1 Tax=Bacillus sp. RO2 TaxID=2723913 RepID=UPI00145EDC76|nr:hypothetical protein [Bacillus sp. RO2]MEA3322187.1 hypothetical protein [Bacillota bacterium]NMH73736.1 hypothetical protein [Bacillus sp. RO2]
MMKNAVVIGATTQVGFALCQYLINKEVEVTGLVWSEKLDEKSEEMLMEIGRNAFFRYQSKRSSTESIDAVFYCLDDVDKLGDKEQVFYDELAENANKLVFISSYRKMSWNGEYRKQIMKKLSASSDPSCYVIYLPMVYGPWQQEEEPVHKRLLEQLEQKESEPIAIKENDVLFVEDVAEAIYTFLNRHERVTEVLFQNDNPKAMEELIKELNLTFLTSVEPEETKKLKKYKVPQRLTIKEGIQAQKDQMYYKLKID